MRYYTAKIYDVIIKIKGFKKTQTAQPFEKVRRSRLRVYGQDQSFPNMPRIRQQNAKMAVPKNITG